MNTHDRQIATVSLIIMALSTGCATAGGTSGRVATAASTASTASVDVRDTHEGLNGVLWTQTSGEFWALASAIYNNAQVALDRAIAEKSSSAALEQVAGYESLPPAVILDLDETVLDNSPAQAQIVLERTMYQQEMWSDWVGRMAAAAIPGVQSFIAFAEKNGIKVFFVTNRAASEQDDTIDVKESRRMEAALRAAGGTVKYTEYVGEKHFIADRVYTDAEFWKWLMAQRLDR